MKIKNIHIGDTVQAKIEMRDGSIKKGDLCTVRDVEPSYYCGDLHLQVRAPDGELHWVNRHDFRKPKAVCDVKIGDEFVITRSHSNDCRLKVGAKVKVLRPSVLDMFKMSNGFTMTANPEGTFEFGGIDIFLEKVKPPILDQSIFDNLDAKWKFAAADKNGAVWAYSETPFIRFESQWMQCGDTPLRVNRVEPNTDWKESLIERKELTGSDLTRKMLADGAKGVLCHVCDSSDEQAVSGGLERYVTGLDGVWFETSISNWGYAVPVERIKIPSKWRHTNGNQYVVSAITNERSEDQRKYPTTVVYTGLDGKVWSRPLADWHRSMTEIKD